MKTNWHKTVKFIQDDWYSHPGRLCVEIFNWFLNIVVVTIFAITVPDVPFLLVYPMFFACLSMSIYSAISRGSFGILMTSSTILLIDLFGYYKILLLQ